MGDLFYTFESGVEKGLVKSTSFNYATANLRARRKEILLTSVGGGSYKKKKVLSLLTGFFEAL